MDARGYTKSSQMTPIRYACFALSILGTVISLYLTVAHFTSSSILACPNTGTIDCARVTTSAQSYFLGLPVAIWGLLFFAYLTLVNSPRGFTEARLRIPRLASVFVGVAFALWLISAELLIINSICLWCTSIHAITILLFGCVIYDFFSAVPEERQGT